MRTKCRRSLVATAAALSLALSACGSDEASAPSESVVKVGLMAAVGTPTSAVPSAPSALAAGIRALNKRGGLNGHPVKMVFCNDKADPNEASRCAREMVDEGVVAITGGYQLFDNNSQPILERAGIPMIGINPLNAELFNAENVYLTGVPGLVAYQALLGYAVKQDLLPVAVAFADNPSGLAFAGLLEDTFKEMSGGEGFAASVPVASNTADYGPIAGSIEAAQPKSVLMVVSAPQQQGLMRALGSRGSDVAAYLAAPSLSLREIRERGELADRMVFAQSIPGLNHDELAQFREELEAQAATGDDRASLETLSPVAVDAWVALQALEQVTKGQETTTAETVTKALNNAKDVELGSGFAPWTPTKPGLKGLSRVSNTNVWFVGFDDGKEVALTDAPVALDDIKAQNFHARLTEAVAKARN